MMDPKEAREKLTGIIAAELATAVDPAVEAAADDLRARFGDGVVAILFYGSCLRTRDYRHKILDFYVLFESYEAVWGKRLLARANAILPPNVFYAETEGDGGYKIRSKVATLSLPHFERLTSRRTFNSSVWARFAQPARLVWSRDELVTRRVVAAVEEAVITLAGETMPLEPASFTAASLWARAFSETYRAELRSEDPDKGREIYLHAAERYDAITPLVLASLGCGRADGDRYSRPLGLSDTLEQARRWTQRWWLRRLQGKVISLLRLIKASFTFDGGIDYLAWKISRHSGVEISVTPWQRRHPVLAGLLMFWRLRRKGAFR